MHRIAIELSTQELFTLQSVLEDIKSATKAADSGDHLMWRLNAIYQKANEHKVCLTQEEAVRALWKDVTGKDIKEDIDGV